MGKLKISKAKKSRSSKGTSGIPNWLLSTIIIVVVIAVLAVCISTALFSTGIPGRLTTAMELDGIKVSQNTMAYFFRTTYANYFNQIYQMLSYNANSETDIVDLAYQYARINPQKSLKDQVSLDGKTTQYDYFLNMTKNTVKQYLVYAAAANKAGVKLDEKDNKDIDAALENLILNISYSLGMPAGYSDNEICAAAYGEGVSKSDVRKGLELETLAKKMSQVKGDEITKSVKEDKNGRITTTYNANPKAFNYVDYLSFSFDVKYEDVVEEFLAEINKNKADGAKDKKAEDLTDDEKAKVLAAYKEKIAEARKKAEELASKTSVADYNKYVSDFVIKDEYDALYKKTMEALKDENLPSEDNRAVIKEKIISAVLTEIAEGKLEANDDTKKTDIPASEDGSTAASVEYSIYDIKISKEYAEKIKTFKEGLFSTVMSTLDAANMEKVSYPTEEGATPTDAQEWAFKAETKALETKTIETGDGANNAEITISGESTNSFSVQVAMLVKPSYRIETLSRDVAFLLYTKEENAKTAIEAVKKIEKLDKDKFLELASSETNPAANSQFLEDCSVLYMQSDKFDNWLFAEDLKENSYTTEPIAMEDGSYLVALYVKQNSTPQWKYLVRNKLINDDYTAFEDRIFASYESKITVKDNALKKLKDTASIY